jgi:hypothetical protein
MNTQTSERLLPLQTQPLNDPAQALIIFTVEDGIARPQGKALLCEMHKR